MRITLLDCYVDEPSCLGVPPFISPYVRYTAGAIEDAGHDYTYITIDEYRRKSQKTKAVENANLLIIIGGAIVPGKYLRGTPASIKEIKEVAERFNGAKILGGPIAKYEFSGNRKAEKLKDLFDFMPKEDIDAFIYDFLIYKSENDRQRNGKEWKRWPQKGSHVITQHPDFPNPLIIELETYRGCVRFHTGGCSFCTEPLFGEPKFRETKDIIDEVKELNKTGAVNFRLGSQSCIYSYGTEQLGESQTPKPNPEKIEKLFRGIRAAAPNLKVLHTDNANPAVIAVHPQESIKITRTLIEYCTSGNVVAFGMESADPKVIKANNLNAKPEQVKLAVEMINKYGAKRGENGMPKLLPGVNFLIGLLGETKRTFDCNFEFLKEILDNGLFLRRINIRQVAEVRVKFHVKTHRTLFVNFKKKVREQIDNKMLERLVPKDTVLKNVLIEKIEGNVSFGRQVGTYPLLVGIPYKTKIDNFMDIIITDHGFRSVTGIEYPLNVNSASLRALSCLPNIGRKRAARIAKSRPFQSEEEFISALDDINVAMDILDKISF